MASPRISVIIPLYNKAQEIEATLRSVLAQTHLPEEIIVVDDGSTDDSRQKVESISSPLIRLLTQENQGVSAARNRGIKAAKAEFISFLDADDRWYPRFLEQTIKMIEEFPHCGLYSTGFYISSHSGLHPAPGLSKRGIVEDFFKESAHCYIAIPSTSTIPRSIFEECGFFPEGMKIGEDLHLWIRIASRHQVCFTPEPLCEYSRVASNRSASSYTPENTPYSFEDLYDKKAPTEQNEFVARAALGKALIICTKGGTDEALRAVEFFRYTKVYRRTWRKVKWLCRVPKSWRPRVMQFYNFLAWKIAKKGL